ncbi:MAG: gluconokinase [Actinobacteria bacterium]|nr:gluconokinase [Actinomycetota bacterium]
MTTSIGADLPIVVGLDVGTSSVKAAVFVGPGAVTMHRQRIEMSVDADGRAIQDPRSVRSAVLDVLGAVIAESRVRPDAIALSTAMHALVGLDARGDPLTPLLTWADARPAEVVADWQQDRVAGFAHARTGVPLHPMAPLAKLAWLRRHDPLAFAAVARWVDLKALVVAWLTGDPVTEVSSASGWAMMDLRTGRWDRDALLLAGVDEAVLPTIASPTATCPLRGDIAERIGAPAGIPVVLGAADGPLANVGAGAVQPGVVGLSLGTSGAARIMVDSIPEVIPDALFCYALTESSWVLGGAVSNGGNITAWLAEEFGLQVGAAVDELAAAAPPGSDGLVMVPYLLADRAPRWDASIPGAYLGLRRHHGRAHLVRAAFEGVAAALGVIVDRIAAVCPVEEVRATGGAFVSPLWRDLVAAAVQRPMVVVNDATGSALGAAAVGLVALRAADGLVDARRRLVGDDDEDAVPVVVSDPLAAAARETRRSIASTGRLLAAITPEFDP